MYELVNTSLPNGLIAGTHGFSTVAMTKGMPDILRGRLESLCAYTHRASVHDVTYLQQNPVNWFHVILPQGDHVVGRVAPYDFDYTGRTNRIARLRVFRSVEMPEIGGAEVLVLEKRWFKERWEGDPHYLEENRNVCGQLRMRNPVYASSAPSWESVFGANGSRYAQQIAWQLERNISEGGKPIYFKTSVEWDVTGEKLLGLFYEVINLLPTAIRSKVTFSTYPVSLPGGISCNLRGVYDRDRLFDAASVSQTWVDCERGQVVHAELLPECDMGDSKEEGNVASATIVADANEALHSNDLRLGVRRAASGTGDKNSYRNLILPQEKGPDMFIIGFVIAGIFVLLAAGLLFYFMIKSNNLDIEAIEDDIIANEEVQNEKSEKAEVVSANKDELNNQGQNNGLAQSIDSDKNTSDKKGATFSKNGHEKKGKDVEKERALSELKKRDQEKRKAAEAQAQLNIAYLDAVKISIGKPTMFKGSKDFTKENGCRVYYYDDNGIVTNQPAEVVKTFNSFVLKWGEGKSEKDLPIQDYGFFVWYNPKLKHAYIDKQSIKKRMSENKKRMSEKLFSKDAKGSIDLESKVFGPDKNFAKLWAKYKHQTKAKVEYKVGWKWKDKEGFFYVEKSKITKDDVVSNESVKNILCKDIDSAIEKLENDIKNCEKNINEVAPIVSAYTNFISICENASNKWYRVECDKDMKRNKKIEEQEKILEGFYCNITNLSKDVKKILDINGTEENKILSDIKNAKSKKGNPIEVVNKKLWQHKTHKNYTDNKGRLVSEESKRKEKDRKKNVQNGCRNSRIGEFSENISEVLFTIELVDVHCEKDKLGVK